MSDMTKHARNKTLKPWQSRTVAAVITAIAVGLAVYAAAADYATVSGQAHRHGVALAWLNPLGILGGLFGITLIDIALTWIGRPIWWLRLFARLFAIGVVAANGSAGWPDPVGVGLRIAAPALFVIITEAGRHTLLRSDEEAERERRRRRDERIPRVRWLLDFRGTLALWKRMRLWRIRSYAAAVDMELSRLMSIEQLAAKYPAGWQLAAPADLVFMLERGVRMEQALKRAAELAKPEPVAERPETAHAPSPKRARMSAQRTRNDDRNNAQAEDFTTEFKAIKLLEEHPALRALRMGAELARQLGVSPATGRRLHAKLTAQDRTADPLSERSAAAAEARSGERS